MEENNQQLSVPKANVPELKKPQDLTVLHDDGTLTTTSGLGIIPSFWGVDSNSIMGIKTAVSVSNTRHGLMAAVPIICKDEECPYHDSCYVEATVRQGVATKGGRCPIEIATIIDRFEMYCKHFNIKDRDQDAVDMGLVKDLVDVEIQILRCDNKIAINGDFVEKIIAGISNQGVPYENPQLSLAWQQKEKLRNERYKIFKLLDSTRSDKAKREISTNDASRKAVDLVAKAMELQKSGKLQPIHMMKMGPIIDVDITEKEEQKPTEVIPVPESIVQEQTPPETPVVPEDDGDVFEIGNSNYELEM